ncbi:protoporphyrinogen oxidase [Tuberibacillus sp. Marseille-P3662]|uniref:protoporphyrinogen oxidase n=1 Tax=Tuberibacillus sp. Marseille-P3662 TaxID=1965358 RepID=UPI000A1CD052|nr:protoporphyrinogen oxidase [Tuberibacillus sp. Marseille-P3662]
MTRHIAIIGGGITGMTAAFYLDRWAKDQGENVNITLFEASDRLGGKVDTVKKEGFVIERGPESFLKRKPEMLELVHDLNMENDLIDNRTGQAFILKNQQLHPLPKPSRMGVPTQLIPFVRNSLMSADGKARVLNDLWIPSLHYDGDISVGDFFSRRFGEELVDDLISPLLSGIYAGDIYKLSLATTLPDFMKLEREHGSLIKGLYGQGKPKSGSQFATLRNGLRSLIEALEAELASRINIVKNMAVKSVGKKSAGYQLRTSTGDQYDMDEVIFATPHHVTAQLLGEPEFLERPNADPNTSVATVAMAFNADDVDLGQDGTGFVVSRRESMAITAATWTHLKWKHAAPEGKALVRSYVGKAGNSAIIHESDETIVQTALADLRTTVDIEAEPDFYVVSRWPEAMPQYPVGQKEWLASAREHLEKNYPGIYLAGASYDGVGLPDCIRQAKEQAADLLNK